MCSHTSSSTSLEALEQQITELASHIHAATCRWLSLIAEYDARDGWAQSGCRSCAHWVSWRCGIAPGPAREHVRVARRLQELPLIRAAFAKGQLSYSKVRALTRVDGVEREQELLDLTRHATAAQLERLLRAYRGVVAAEQAAEGGRPPRWITVDHDDDGSVLLRGRLPAEEGALLIAALDAARDAAPGEAEDVPAGTSSSTAGEARADALVLMAETLLASGPAARTGGDRYQVLVHMDTAALRGSDAAQLCQTDEGSPLATETARRLACDASIVTIAQRDGKTLDVGRKTRSIPPALRRALRSRHRGCCYPGCTARRFVDAHHIEHWADGGATKLGNLVHVCRHHHRLLHEGGYTVTRHADGRFTFRRPDGRRIPECPAAPRGRPEALRNGRRVEADACVSLSAGERLDLDLGVGAMLMFAPIAAGEPPGV